MITWTLSVRVSPANLYFRTPVSLVTRRLIATQTLEYGSKTRVTDRRTPTWEASILASSRQTEQKKTTHEKNVHRSIRKLMSGNELTMSRGRVTAGIAKTRPRWRLRSGTFNRMTVSHGILERNDASGRQASAICPPLPDMVRFRGDFAVVPITTQMLPKGVLLNRHISEILTHFLK